MRSIASLATLIGLVLLNFLATGVGKAYGQFEKVPAPPYPPTLPKGATYDIFIVGATSDTVPPDTVGYEFDLHFDTSILSLASAIDDLVGDPEIDISPLPDGVHLLAMRGPAVPNDLITSLVFSADHSGSSTIALDTFSYYAASGPGGEIVALPQSTDGGMALLINVVPEPSSVMLIGVGLALLVPSRRRRFRQRPPALLETGFI